MLTQKMNTDVQQKWMRLVEQAWADDALKQRLLTDPVSALRESGIEVPAGIEVRVVEPTERQVYFLLPPPPGAAAELTADELNSVAGGIEAYLQYDLENCLISSSGGGSGSSCWSCAMF